MNSEEKIPSHIITFFKLLLIILVFMPKISLYNIPGFWQGLRFEDIAVLLFVYTIFKKKIPINFNSFGGYFFYFFLYFMFCAVVGNLLDDKITSSTLSYISASTKILFYVRYIEYIAVILLISCIDASKTFYVKFAAYIILLNFIAVLLQNYGMLGVVSSKGYFPTPPFSISYGIFGGPWELSFIVAISYLIIVQFSDNTYFKIILLPLVFFMLYEAETKGNMLGFTVAIFLFFLSDLRKYFLIFFLIFISLFLFFYDQLFFLEKIYNPSIKVGSLVYEPFIQSLIGLDFDFIYTTLYNFFVFQKSPIISDMPSWSYLSFKYRIDTWLPYYEIYLTNFFTIIFGTGFGSVIYIESFILRILFSFGIAGIILITYMVRKFPLYFFVFIFLCGVTLDLFSSMKIFTITSIYMFCYRKEFIK
jgi:hypothetical protein